MPATTPPEEERSKKAKKKKTPRANETVAADLHYCRRHRAIPLYHSSTDGTRIIARQYDSNQVRVVRQPNQGAAAAEFHISW